MSASLVRRGLDLLSEDLKGVGKGQKKKKKSTKRTFVMDQITSDKQGVRKQVRRLQTHNAVRKNKATVKEKHVKNALAEYRKKQKKSQLRKNLQYFLGSSYKTRENDTKKILQQNAGRQSRHQPDHPVTKEQEKSVFTEEQFQKFQEEYFSKL